MRTFQLPTRIGIRDLFPIRNAHRWGGLAFVVGNLLFVLNKLNDMSRVFLARPMSDVISGRNLGLIFFGQAALIIGYIAYYQCYAPRVGWTGIYALRLLCGGGIVLAVGHVSFMSALAPYVPTALVPYIDSLFLLVLFGLLLLLIGLIWFGLLNLRRPVLRYWHWLPLCTGLFGFIGFFLFREVQITATFLLLRTLFACGLIGLGIILALEKPVQPD